MDIKIPYPLEHTCELCGCSCMAQLVGPLSEQELFHVMDAHRQLAEEGAVDRKLNPIMKGIKPDGSCLHFLNFPQKTCAFLGEDHLCKIHGKFDAMKKPAACRRFPLIAIRTENDVRVAIKPYCYANIRKCKITPAPDDILEQYRNDPEMNAVLDDLIENASFRPVIRINDREELERAEVQEREITAWLRGDISYAELLPALIRGRREKRTSLPKPFLQDVVHAFKSLKPHVETEAQKLAGSAQAKHVHDLCRCLGEPISGTHILENEHDFWKYARHALHNAVFLRETSRFPDVSTGTFALALGCLAAASDPDKAADHLTTWMRLFAQTRLFESLFPSPQVMAALSRHLI